MPYDPKHGHAALRRGRFSAAHAEYFLTVSTNSRETDLTQTQVAAAIRQEMHAMECDESWQVRCGTTMPDHIHLLVILGVRLSLSRCMARLKAKTASRLYGVAGEWQSGFYDHRLRDTDDRAPVFRYIHRNPYVENLVPSNVQWPHWYCRPEDWKWFKHEMGDDGGVEPDWLR